MTSTTDQIKQTFRFEKIENEKGLFKGVWISPFKMKSGHIVSVQPLHIRSTNEMDLHTYIDTLNDRFLTEECFFEDMHVQIKHGDAVKYFEIYSHDELIVLFEHMGGINIEETLKLHAIVGEGKPCKCGAPVCQKDKCPVHGRKGRNDVLKTRRN